MNKYVYLGYVSRNTSPISKRTLIKHTCSWRVNLLCYEHWTEKQKKIFFTLHLILSGDGVYICKIMKNMLSAHAVADKLLVEGCIKTTDHRPTDPPTTYQLPTDPPTIYPPTHRLAIINLR